MSLCAMMQKTASEIECELLTIIAGNGNLSFQLPFCRGELGCAKRFLHDTIQLFSHQTAAFLDIMMVATEVDTPQTCIRIAGHDTFNGIYQSMTFSQGKAKAGIHARTT